MAFDCLLLDLLNILYNFTGQFYGISLINNLFFYLFFFFCFAYALEQLEDLFRAARMLVLLCL